MLVSVLDMLYVLCCGCDKLSCLSNVHSSAQTLLLACSFEPHPATTLSPVSLPWQPSITHSSKDTGYSMQHISVATSASSLYAPYSRAAMLALMWQCWNHGVMIAAALLHHSCTNCDTGVQWHTALELEWHPFLLWHNKRTGLVSG